MMPSDVQIYCNCMAEVRNRIGVVQAVLEGRATTGADAFNVELIFLQLRKALELIALGSISANKTVYSAAHKNFAKHWKAKVMLDEVEKVNPDFYPAPLDPPQEIAPGVNQCFEPPAGGFLTKDEFASLYDLCSEVVHTRNPYAAIDPAIQIGYSVQEWVTRIQRLLSWHVMHLVDGDKWVVNIPDGGSVHAWPASRGVGQK
jgi:hypothetical protein